MWLRLTITTGLVLATGLTQTADIQAAVRARKSHSRRLHQGTSGVRPDIKGLASRLGSAIGTTPGA